MKEFIQKHVNRLAKLKGKALIKAFVAINEEFGESIVAEIAEAMKLPFDLCYNKPHSHNITPTIETRSGEYCAYCGEQKIKVVPVVVVEPKAIPTSTRFTITKADEMKMAIIELLEGYISERRQDIDSGIEEGIYEESDNVETYALLAEQMKLVEQYKDLLPAIFVYVEGGNIQGMSGNMDIGVSIYDMDNYKADRKAYIEDNGTPEEWNAMIEKRNNDGTLKGIY